MCLSACPRGSPWGAVCLPRVASPASCGGRSAKPASVSAAAATTRCPRPAAHPHLPLASPSDSPRAALTASHLTRRPRGPPLGPRLLFGRGP